MFDRRFLFVAYLCCCLIACGDEAPDARPTLTVVAARLPAPKQAVLTASPLDSRRQTIRMAVPGRLVSLPPAQGTRVSRGDLLAAVEVEPLQATLLEQRAAFQQIDADIKRRRGVRREGLQPGEDLAALEDRLQRAREQVLSAEYDVIASRCVAPFSGIVREVLVGEERLLAADAALLVLEDDRLYDMVLRIERQGLGREILALDDEALGDRLQFFAVAGDGEYALDVVESQREEGALILNLRSEAPLNVSGDPQVRLVLAPPWRPLVPVTAVQMHDGRQRVYVAEARDEDAGSGWIPVERQVRIARIDGSWVSLLDGVDIGDLIISQVPEDIDRLLVIDIEEVEHAVP